jgi:hypothetical protein
MQLGVALSGLATCAPTAACSFPSMMQLSAAQRRERTRRTAQTNNAL